MWTQGNWKGIKEKKLDERLEEKLKISWKRSWRRSVYISRDSNMKDKVDT